MANKQLKQIIDYWLEDQDKGSHQAKIVVDKTGDYFVTTQVFEGDSVVMTWPMFVNSNLNHDTEEVFEFIKK